MHFAMQSPSKHACHLNNNLRVILKLFYKLHQFSAVKQLVYHKLFKCSHINIKVSLIMRHSRCISLEQRKKNVFFSLQKLPFIRRTRVARCSSYYNQNINNLIKKESPKLKVVTNDQCLKNKKTKKNQFCTIKFILMNPHSQIKTFFFCLINEKIQQKIIC